MRIMACDYGSKTIGIAMSDPFGWTAQGIEIIRRKEEDNLVGSFVRLKELIEEYAVEKIVVGLPKNMNNSLGDRVDKTLHFIERLKKEVALPIVTWDERLSTIGAERALLEADLSRAKRKKVIDKMAAAYFLQGYLDAKVK